MNTEAKTKAKSKPDSMNICPNCNIVLAPGIKYKKLPYCSKCGFSQWPFDRVITTQELVEAEELSKKFKIEGMNDSGKREHFESGAMREPSKGKGRYDLISPIALKRLAIVLEKGAEKYADRNWEKGMPTHRYMDSALRHLNQYLAGMRDEDHLGHAMFNVMALIHTEEEIENGNLAKELSDLPNS